MPISPLKKPAHIRPKSKKRDFFTIDFRGDFELRAALYEAAKRTHRSAGSLAYHVLRLVLVEEKDKIAI